MLRSIPSVLALLVLAAHFYRAAALVPAVSCVAAIAQDRMAAGKPYLRMLVILGAVTAFTAVAAWALGRPDPPNDRKAFRS